MEIISTSIAQTEAYARDFIQHLMSTPTHPGATVVGLYGDLGAGKTAFTKAVANILNIKEEVTSPTFVIEKIYIIGNREAPEPPHALATSTTTSFQRLIHIDAYRLEKSEELVRIGWNDIVVDPANLIFIEWPERVANVMPHGHIQLHFTFIDETTRKIERK